MCSAGSTMRENIAAAARPFTPEGANQSGTSSELDLASWQVSASIEAVSLVLLYTEDEASLGMSQVQHTPSMSRIRSLTCCISNCQKLCFISSIGWVSASWVLLVATFDDRAAHAQQNTAHDVRKVSYGACIGVHPGSRFASISFVLTSLHGLRGCMW